MQARLLILNPISDAVFLDNNNELPRAPLPDNPAEVTGIVQFADKQLGLDIAVLSCLQYESSKGGLYLCGVLDEPGDAMRWHPLDALSPADLTAVINWRNSGDSRRAPWTNIQWHQNVRQWVEEKLPQAGFYPQGKVHQFHCWEISCILKVPTTSGLLYLKAVPPIFASEPGLVQWLNQKVPGQVPEVVATDSSRGWFLTRDFGGYNLGDSEDYQLWQQAISAYARLQIKTVSLSQEILSLGCLDRRLPQLISHCRQLADYLSDTPERETGISSEQCRRWQQAIPRLEEMAEKLDSFNIPYTLEHGDLHCGNIQVTDRGFVFFDWTDGSLAHPFFSLDPFLKEGPKNPEIRSRLLQAYLNVWREYLPGVDCTKAFNLSRVLALAHQTWSYHLIARSVEPAAGLSGVLGSVLAKTLAAVEDFSHST